MESQYQACPASRAPSPLIPSPCVETPPPPAPWKKQPAAKHQCPPASTHPETAPTRIGAGPSLFTRSTTRRLPRRNPLHMAHGAWRIMLRAPPSPHPHPHTLAHPASCICSPQHARTRAAHRQEQAGTRDEMTPLEHRRRVHRGLEAGLGLEGRRRCRPALVAVCREDGVVRELGGGKEWRVCERVVSDRPR